MSYVSQPVEPNISTPSASSPTRLFAARQQCAICLEEVTNVIRLLHRCNHPSACMSCLWTLYIDHRLNEESPTFPLRCFWPECNRTLRDVQIRRLARNQKEIQLYYRQQSRARLRCREEKQLLQYALLQQRRVRPKRVLQSTFLPTVEQSELRQFPASESY